jgi:hypothetical protein
MKTTTAQGEGVGARTSRRRLLSGLGVAAGALGVAGVEARQAPAARTPALPAVIHGAGWRTVWPGVKPGSHPPMGAPRLPHGHLVDAHGAHVGAFEASLMPTSGTGSHMHRLELADGTLTAVGPATFDDATFAVIGGTGRFAGASGSYHLVQRPAASGGTATFTLDITTPEA